MPARMLRRCAYAYVVGIKRPTRLVLGFRWLGLVELVLVRRSYRATAVPNPINRSRRSGRLIVRAREMSVGAFVGSLNRYRYYSVAIRDQRRTQQVLCARAFYGY
jgi:hypothetical protein